MSRHVFAKRRPRVKEHKNLSRIQFQTMKNVLAQCKIVINDSLPEMHKKICQKKKTLNCCIQPMAEHSFSPLVVGGLNLQI